MGARNRRLDTTLFGGTRLTILRLMFTHSGQRLYYREICASVGGQGAAQRELRRLVEAGILNKLGDRRRTYYSPNPDCPIYNELRQLFRKLARQG
jgi:DNA-binding transcriptional ArsR family regulator